MIYFYANPLENFKHSDAKRFKLTGYPGGVYKAVDNADYGGGVEHCTEWVQKYSYTIKLMSDETLGGQTPVQGGITLE